MADVMMEFKGVRKRVPADRVAHFQSKGAVVVADTAPAATPAASLASKPPEPEGPGFMQRARDLMASTGERLQAAKKTSDEGTADLLRGASQGASLGFADELGGLAGAAGALFGAARDEATGFGTHEDPLEEMREAYREGRGGERAKVEAARERSPIASTVGQIAGGLAIPVGAAGQAATLPGKVAAGAGSGALAGAVGGAGEAASMEEAPESAAIGGALGGAFGLIPGAIAAAPSVRRAVTEGGRRMVGRVPDVADRLAGVLERGVGAAEGANPLARGGAAMLTSGGSEAVVGGAKAAAKGLRQVAGRRPTGSPALDASDLPDDYSPEDLQRFLDRMKGEEIPPVPAAPQAGRAGAPALDTPEGLDEALQALETPPTTMPAAAPEEVVQLVQRKAPAAIATPEDMGAALDELAAKAKPVPAPPAPGRGPAGEVLTDLRRGVLGRRPTQTEIRDAIEAVAIREGTTDIATLSNITGVPTTELRDVLVPMLRDFQFRQRVAGTPGVGPASSAADEAAQMGRTIREARGSAQSPIDNVSGRPARQVAAVRQQEQWRAAYDRLPAEQRATFIEQLRRESGLPDDTIRQRLKLTKAEWRRTSFTRSQAREPGAPTESMPGPRPPIRQ